MTLQSADIDVNPPRASKLAKKIPVGSMASTRRGVAATTTAIASVAGALRTDPNFHGGIPEILSLAVPGLHQWRRGEIGRARILFGVYAAVLVLAMLLAGTGPGSLVLGLLFAWHVISAVDAIARNFVVPADRIRLTFIVGLGLFCLLYLPTGWLIRQIATPMSIAMQTTQFGLGDVVWVQSSTPSPGDLVLYDLPQINIQAREIENLYPVNYQVGGPRINRLAAVGGQTVNIDERGRIFVDGQEMPWRAKEDGAILPRGRDIKVRPGYVFILPEDLLPGVNYSLKPDTSLRLAMVPEGSVTGPLLLRSYPITRFRFY